jgi:hypothetical protein
MLKCKLFWLIYFYLFILSSPLAVSADSSIANYLLKTELDYIEQPSQFSIDSIENNIGFSLNFWLFDYSLLSDYIGELYGYKGDDGCNMIHNGNKQYSVAEAANFLTTLLDKGNFYYSKFKCDNPNSQQIPFKVKKIYGMSTTWNPIYGKKRLVKDDYIQCVAFVFMAYQLADKPIIKQGPNSHAISLAGYKYINNPDYNPIFNAKVSKYLLIRDNRYLEQFVVFASGKTIELPVVGDLMVWKDNPPYGHVGIVTEVDEIKKKIVVVGSNSSKVEYSFAYTLGLDDIITIDPNRSWKPDFWVRKRIK